MGGGHGGVGDGGEDAEHWDWCGGVLVFGKGVWFVWVGWMMEWVRVREGALCFGEWGGGEWAGCWGGVFAFFGHSMSRCGKISTTFALDNGSLSDGISRG